MYDPKGVDPAIATCPCCEHTNRPSDRPPAEPEHDPLKTMTFSGLASSAIGRESHAESGRTVETGNETKLLLTLVVEDSSRETHTLSRARTTLGRGLCDVRVEDPEVSRQHCAIELREGIPMLVDLGSANGTQLNGAWIKESVLADGDEIQIGSIRLRFHIAPAD